MADTYRTARLPIRLRGFISPDTSSQFEGYVEPGTYFVIEEKRNFPNADTDYVKLEVPTLGALDTWICSRSGTQKYAELRDEERAPPTPRMSFADDPLAVPEDKLVALLET